MNKQAILITAYKDTSSLVQLVSLFDENFNFYIHVDKKSNLNTSDLDNLDNVFISQKYKTKWGGVNHLKAILYLSNEAMKNNENSFFHLITGEDFPIKSINRFLELDQSKNYLDYFEIKEDNYAWLDRLKRYQFYDYFNAKIERQLYYLTILVRLQRKYKIERSLSNINFQKLFAGSTYWSLNREALKYVVNFPDKNVLNRLKYTFCSEEFYFQTILLNSPLVDSIVCENLRYYDWISGRGGYPAFLDNTDFEKLISLKNCFFARKIKSNSLLREKLIKHISSNQSK